MKYKGAKEKVQGKSKVVHVLSTNHKANMKDTQKRNAHRDIIQKQVVVYYNHKMGGVDSIN